MATSDVLWLVGILFLLAAVGGLVSFSTWMRRYGPVWFVSALHDGKYELALSRLKRALRWDPDLVVWEPVLLIEAGRPQRARERLVHLLMEPRPPAGEALCRFLLAQALLELGQGEPAALELDRSAHLVNGPRVSWLRAELALRAGVGEGAAQHAHGAVEGLAGQGGSRFLGDPTPLFHATLAWALAVADDPEAAAALEDAESRLPAARSELAGCAWRLGHARRALGQPDAARSWWRRGGQADPDGADGARCLTELAPPEAATV